VEPGERVLIHGAGGGVGVFAVQLVAAAGAKAVALASRRHHELLLQLGATAAIDYRDPDALATARQRAGGEFDACRAASPQFVRADAPRQSST
jgi:NADPH:quinone reductase-like Zn-dependent oxidoreductase